MTWMIYRIRPTNRTVYDDLESRRFTVVNFEPPHRRSSLSTQDVAGLERQEFYSATRCDALL
jgi:hypothetical protein